MILLQLSCSGQSIVTKKIDGVTYTLIPVEDAKTLLNITYDYFTYEETIKLLRKNAEKDSILIESGLILQKEKDVALKGKDSIIENNFLIIDNLNSQIKVLENSNKTLNLISKSLITFNVALIGYWVGKGN